MDPLPAEEEANRDRPHDQVRGEVEVGVGRELAARDRAPKGGVEGPPPAAQHRVEQLAQLGVVRPLGREARIDGGEGRREEALEVLREHRLEIAGEAPGVDVLEGRELAEGLYDEGNLRGPASVDRGLPDSRAVRDPFHGERREAHFGEELEGRVEDRAVRLLAAGAAGTRAARRGRGTGICADRLAQGNPFPDYDTLRLVILHSRREAPMAVDYHPFSPEVMEDPHPVYRRLREQAPCFHLAEWDTYFLSRFEDIWNASMDAQSFSTAQGTTTAQLVTKVQPVTPMLNSLDPPAHTRFRSQLTGFFTPGRVRRLEPRIQRFVDDAFAEVRELREADVFNQFAAKVSVKVACLANGFPMEDSDMLNTLVWRFFAREEGVTGMTPDGVAAMMEMFAYFTSLIGARRAAGASEESVVDLVCRFEDTGGKRFELQDAASHLSMFLIGGAETFPKTFASTAHRLWQHPEQRALLVRDPALIPDAYREVLRYDMPTQYLMRKIVKPVRFHGVECQPGANLALLYPSANRDPREFRDPDVFDVKRVSPRILSFGHGIHVCIGQHFAKLEAKLCIRKLLDFAPNYEVQADKLERLRTEFVQGWATMPIVFHPG